MKSLKFFIILLLCFAGAGCKKFTEIPPPKTSLTSDIVFDNATTANQAQLSIYSQIVVRLSSPLSKFPALSADEFINYSTNSTNVSLYQNALLANNSATYNIWQYAYQFIFQANEVIEGVKKSNKLNVNLKNQLIGEAEFTRALLYFYLVNLYGDVPLTTTTNYNETSLIARSSTNEVYSQIVNDLKDAENILSTGFVGADGISTSSERIRPTKSAASAILARVYLYMGDWSNAYKESSNVISNQTFGLVTNLNDVFKMNSKEAIWQLSNEPFNTPIARDFILTGTPSDPIRFTSISTQLYAAFEANDARKNSWVGVYTNNGKTYYYPFKYQAPNTVSLQEYVMMLRLGEQYLVRAEAQANGAGNGLAGGISDLNAIRNRAGLAPYSGSATDKATILNAIMHERQVELFSEFGHRWLDLKRTKTVDAVMSIVTPGKGNTWSSYQQLWPIPQSDIKADKNLTQNAGY